MKPIIGVVSSINSDLVSEIQRNYLACIEKAGGMPIVIPYTNDEDCLDYLLNMCDGIMLTGGADVSPELYNEVKREVCQQGCRARDEFELLIFEKALYSFKPVLAICRGCHLVNVALGGTLYQDIPSEYPNPICHKQEDMFSFSHEIDVYEGTPLFELLNQGRIKTNSFHHQCIKDLGRLLEVMAVTDDGIIEAFYMPSYRYLRGYQWHPERLFQNDENNFKIFEDFINESKKQGEEK